MAQLGAKGAVTCSAKYRTSALQTDRLTQVPGKNLVDCISLAHPSLLTKEEIDALAVPVQIIAPEHDPALKPELKAHANSVIPGLNIEYDYQYFPGMTHGFAARCDAINVNDKKALERAKNAAVAWFVQFLHL